MSEILLRTTSIADQIKKPSIRLMYDTVVNNPTLFGSY